MAARSLVRLWRGPSDYVALEYAKAEIGYAACGERILDRRGVVHRLTPSVPRYPVRLGISFPEEALLDCSTSAPVLSVLEWLEARHAAQEELAVFVLGETLRTDGQPCLRQLAYLCFIEELPEECFGTLPPAGAGPGELRLECLVIAHGTFADFDILASTSLIPRTV